MGLVEDPSYETVTKLYREMEICSEYLHCTHDEFMGLGLGEKCKWYSFIEMKINRQSYTNKKEREKKQHRESHLQNTMGNRKNMESTVKLGKDKGRLKR